MTPTSNSSKAEWRESNLAEISEIILGQSPKGESCNQLGIGKPLLNSPTEFGIRYPMPVQYTNEPTKISKSGDILFCVRGSTTGRMNWSDKKYVIGRGLAAIRHIHGSEYQYFVKGILDHHLQYLLASATGSTFPNVSRDQLAGLNISLPPLPEQKAIASVFSSLDNKIDFLHRQNKTLESMAETLFRQWFVDSECTCKVSDLIQIQNGYAFKSKDFQELGTNGVIKIKNISGDIVDIYKSDFVSELVADKLDLRFSISSGDILFAMTGAEIGKMGIVPETKRKLWLNQRVGLFKEKFPGSRFLAYLQLKSEYGQDYIENTATGSAQPNISSDGILNCGFPEISEKDTVSFSEKISPLFNKVIGNLGQIYSLEKLRDTLLPKLMSGEVRVDV